MDVWLALSFFAPEEMVPLAQLAEQCGYAGVALPDHLLWPQQSQSRYPHADGGKATWNTDAPWVDVWVTAAAILQATTSLRFTSNVYIPLLRSPYVVAKAVSTAAMLSNYRLALGVGTGWLKEEFDAAGVAFAGRGKALDDSLATIRALWTGEVVEATDGQRGGGGVRMLPAPAQPILIWVGGTGEPALRRAAANDGWIGVLHTDVTHTVEQAQRMRQLRAQAAAPTDPFMMAVTG
ncbi:MAG: putative F420-dependent oxidoreductase, Rv2161c family protein, partial [Acidimicrobiia bacterium]|nr:putative F420-dependent oxidoreductase, Rv2161c family protein [Acidimicrobiia bacterium]